MKIVNKNFFYLSSHYVYFESIFSVNKTFWIFMKLSTNFHEKITFLGKITFIGYFSPISCIIRQNFNEKMPIDNFSEKQPLTNLLLSNFFGTVPRPFSNQVTKTYTYFIYFINTCWIAGLRPASLLSLHLLNKLGVFSVHHWYYKPQNISQDRKKLYAKDRKTLFVRDRKTLPIYKGQKDTLKAQSKMGFWS